MSSGIIPSLKILLRNRDIEISSNFIFRALTNRSTQFIILPDDGQVRPETYRI